jgi:hypothetical protein
MQEVEGSIPFASTSPDQGIYGPPGRPNRPGGASGGAKRYDSLPVTKRRGAGEGGLYRETRTRTLVSGEKVESLLWVGVVEAERDPETGRRRRVKIKATTKTDTIRKMRVERERLAAGQAPLDPSMTVERFLRSWATDVLPHRVAPGTVANYRS